MKVEQEKKLILIVGQCKKAINTGYQGIEAALMDSDEAHEALKAKADRYTNEALNDENAKIVQKMEEGIADAVEAANNAIRDLKAEYMTVVNEYYRPDGSRIDPDDNALLNSGIQLQNDEIMEMIKKHRDNTTMLRIIAGYVSSHGIGEKIPYEMKVVLSRAAKGGDNEERVFDRFVHLAAMGFGHPDTNYTLYQGQLDDYEEQAVIDIKKATLYQDAEVLKQIRDLEHAQLEKHNDARKHLDPGHMIGGRTGYLS